MCGRFVSYFDPADLVDLFDADRATDLPAPSWNVAPTNQVAIVRDCDPTEGKATAREVRGARWGLIPSWAKDPKIGSRLINARSETITVKPAFRAAAKARRTLLPAAGYYEWQGSANGSKTPFFLHPADEGLIAMAGLYEWWRPPERLGPDGPVQPGLTLSTTVVTRAATDTLGAIHDRMPLVVPRDLWGAWLSPELNTPSAVEALIEEIPDPVLIPRRVSPAVGSVRNNGPDLIRPVS
jgi:putative SOS response-associated peptidase YedK